MISDANGVSTKEIDLMRMVRIKSVHHESQAIGALLKNPVITAPVQSGSHVNCAQENIFPLPLSNYENLDVWLVDDFLKDVLSFSTL